MVLGVSQLQPQRPVPGGGAREFRERGQLVPLEGLSLLPQEDRDEGTRDEQGGVSGETQEKVVS